MERITASIAIVVACLLAGCGAPGGAGPAGGPPDAMEDAMLSTDGMSPNTIDDATGTMVP